MQKPELNIESFCLQIKQNHLLNTSDQILVGVSGGLDSMTLLHLLHSCGYSISVAHINYQLRGNDSELDKELVQQYCEKKHIPFYSKDVQMDATSSDSLQMQARTLRYAFFQICCTQYGLNKIALAHHANDQVETLVMHFAKGPTLFGMEGIPIQKENWVRPLLTFDQAQIQAYAKKHSIQYRIDASNKNKKYQRNLIRHELIPAIEKINPSFQETILDSQTNFQQDQELIKAFVHLVQNTHCKKSELGFHIPKACLDNPQTASALLFYLVRSYQFTRDQCRQIYASIDRSGAQFHSEEYMLQIRMDDLVISKSIVKQDVSLVISKDTVQIVLGDKQLIMSTATNTKIELSNDIVQLDVDQLRFPLHIRTWKSGDSFKPLGLNGKTKKVSDLLNDKKLTVIEKQQVWILEDVYQNMLAVLGLARSEAHRIQPTTQEIFQLHIKKATP